MVVSKDRSLEQQFGLDDRLYGRVLAEALARGGDFADLFFQQRSSLALSLLDHEINRGSRSEDLGVGIRVVDNERSGYAFCESFDEASLLAAARTASAIASGGARSDVALEVKTQARSDYYPVERPWQEVDVGERLPILDALDRQTFAKDPRIEKVRVRLVDAESSVLIVDSTGRKVSDYRPMSVCTTACVMRSGSRREENSVSVGGRHGIDFYGDATLAELATRVVDRTAILLEARRPQGGPMPVVLAAGSAGILLHEAIGHGMEADFIRRGTSIYTDALDKRIASEDVTIVDDGTIAGARGSINVDDEGNPSRRTVLVEQGILRSFMHDRISAAHFNTDATGSGRRQSFRHLPLPRMRSTYMLDGPRDPEEIIQSVKRGIFAQTFTNGQVQIGAGDFTFYIKNGYLIEDGKLTAPVKDVNIIGNGPQVLEAVTMVGNDFRMDQGGWTCGKDGQGVPVSLGMPTVKVAEITVGGVQS